MQKFEGAAPPKGRNVVCQKQSTLGGLILTPLTFLLVDQSSPKFFLPNSGWVVVDNERFQIFVMSIRLGGIHAQN